MNWIYLPSGCFESSRGMNGEKGTGGTRTSITQRVLGLFFKIWKQYLRGMVTLHVSSRALAVITIECPWHQIHTDLPNMIIPQQGLKQPSRPSPRIGR
jgi:hypothetical protein